MSKENRVHAGRILHLAPAPPGHAPLGVALTVRERDLIRLIGQGMTDRQMGAALCISEWTVKTHVQNLREKFQVHTRAAVVAVSWDLLRDGPIVSE